MNANTLSAETLFAMLLSSRRPALFASMFSDALELQEEVRYLNVSEGQEPPPESAEDVRRREIYEELCSHFLLMAKLEEKLEEEFEAMQDADDLDEEDFSEN